MRGIIIFVCGALFGLFIETDRAGNINPDVVMLNKVSIAVNDMDESLAFYTEMMGFEERSRLANEEGQMTSAYLSVSENTFLELNLASEYVPPGLLYIGVQVEDIASVKDIYESRGARLRETRRAGTQAILSYIIDPQGVPIQLSEYPPD